jgi:hypothetical protein
VLFEAPDGTLKVLAVRKERAFAEPMLREVARVKEGVYSSMRQFARLNFIALCWNLQRSRGELNQQSSQALELGWS